MEEILLPLALAINALGGAMLIGAGATKLTDLNAAKIGILDYRIVPGQLAMPTAIVLGASELACGVGLFLAPPLAGPVAVLLLSLISLAVVSALARRLEIECHCGVEGERLTPWTLRRNAAAICALGVSSLLLPADLTLAPATLGLRLETALATALAVAVATNVYAMVRAIQIANRVPKPRKHVCGGAL